MPELSNDDIRDLRHAIRDLQQSVAGLNTFREADSLRMSEINASITRKLDHIETRVDSMDAQMNKWRGMGFVVMALGGIVGSGATWFFSK